MNGDQQKWPRQWKNVTKFNFYKLENFIQNHLFALLAFLVLEGGRERGSFVAQLATSDYQLSRSVQVACVFR